MGRIIVAVALIGWAAIASIAWRLADLRISRCYPGGVGDGDCIIRTTATRDFTLTVGLTGGLLIIVIALIAAAVARSRARRVIGWTVPANRGQQTLPR